MKFVILDNTAWTGCSDALKLEARYRLCNDCAVVSALHCPPRQGQHPTARLPNGIRVASVVGRYNFFFAVSLRIIPYAFSRLHLPRPPERG